mmetsp:Transcript_1554/g.1706  ORF Transcript_1554/g.1706 Transcript_1554/m.1706 type:complete len:111 (+) Transcript_1554:89-421(+)
MTIRLAAAETTTIMLTSLMILLQQVQLGRKIVRSLKHRELILRTLLKQNSNIKFLKVDLLIYWLNRYKKRKKSKIKQIKGNWCFVVGSCGVEHYYLIIYLVVPKGEAKGG